MPIIGKRKVDLSINSIYQRLSPYDLYRHYFGPFELNKAVCNHLRGDKNPSMIIGNKYGEISHFDLGNPKWRGDAISLVQQINGHCNLDTALRIIDRDFNLGIASGTPNTEYKNITSQYEQPKIEKRSALIQVVTRKFTTEELKYWSEYHQDVADLRKNDIYSIKTMYFNKQKFPLKDTDLRFGYYYGGYWKLYRPFLDKKNKWLGNVPLQTSWGTENLKKDKNSLVCKSRKDFMVCKKVYDCVTGVQNESLAAFSEEFVKTLKESSNVVYYGGDADKPGKEASYAITGEFGFKHINSPDRLLPQVNDLAEWGKVEGLKALEEHFKIKGLIL